MDNCKWQESCRTKDCPAPYCKFNSEEDADRIFDLIDEYIELKESVLGKNKVS